MQIGELLLRGIEELRSAGVDEAAADTALLLGHCLKLSRTQVYLAVGEDAPEESVINFLTLLGRRKCREPVAYILGEREFWSLPFRVTRDVLIPRPETEFVLETALKVVKTEGLAIGPMLDLCCGSGVIAVVLARELGRQVIATDISLKALAVAQENANRHGVKDLVSFLQSDLLSAIGSHARLPLVLANPPYVTTQEMKYMLEPEVSRFEPSIALNGGDTGLRAIAGIRRGLPRVLGSGGWFFMEIGAKQGGQVAALFADGSPEGSFDRVRIIPDYAGRDRVLCARFTRR